MLLTPPGAAAIAVVRIAGPKVREFLAAHFSKPLVSNRCVHGNLFDGSRIIDDPVIVPGSDERFADINLHGGEWVVRECLELAKRWGFEVVGQSDDLLDSEDVFEREMLAALPLARTEEAIRMLLMQPDLWQRAQFDKEQASRMLMDRSLWWMLHPPRIAIVGIPNVGKSTLANQLFGQARSITADVPGTTRDWVGDWANIDGLPVHLLDTPGQRETSDSIEQAAIRRSGNEIERADLVILVLDPTQPLVPSQDQIRAKYPDSILVINKSDLCAVWDVNSIDAIRTVASMGKGIDALRARIRSHFQVDFSESPRWWTQRQQEFLR